MELEDYQDWVEESWKGPKSKEFAAIGLGGEVGEVLNEIKKELRDEDDRHEKVMDEMGDVLHYFCKLANLYGFTLEEIAKANVKKCKDRNKIGFSVSKGKDVAHS